MDGTVIWASRAEGRLERTGRSDTGAAGCTAATVGLASTTATDGDLSAVDLAAAGVFLAETPLCPQKKPASWLPPQAFSLLTPWAPGPVWRLACLQQQTWPWPWPWPWPQAWPGRLPWAWWLAWPWLPALLQLGSWPWVSWRFWTESPWPWLSPVTWQTPSWQGQRLSPALSQWLLSLSWLVSSRLVSWHCRTGGPGCNNRSVQTIRGPVHLHGLAFVRPSGPASRKWGAFQAGHCSD